MHIFDRFLTGIERAMMWIACAAMLAIMCVMVLDVTMRYLFSAPLHWAYEVLTRYLLLLVFFFSVSSVLRKGEHLVLDLLSERLPRLLRHGPLALLFLASAVVWAMTLAMTWQVLIENWTRTQLVPGIGWPMWTSTAIVVAGLAVLTLRTVLEGLVNLRASIWAGPKPPRPSGEVL